MQGYLLLALTKVEEYLPDDVAPLQEPEPILDAVAHAAVPDGLGRVLYADMHCCQVTSPVHNI